MKLSTIRKRSAATALFLAVAMFGAACADTDAESPGQAETEATETETDATEGTEESTEGESGEGEAGSMTARVGAKYAANVFTLIGTDHTEDGKIVAITDGSVDVRTSQTISYEGEVVDFSDPQVAETIGEEQYEQLEPDFAESQVLLVSSYDVQE
jgi:hypothetical protein